MTITVQIVLWSIALIAIYTIIAYLQGRQPSFLVCIMIGLLTFAANNMPSPLTKPTVIKTDKSVIVYGNIKAPAEDFLLPESNSEYLSQERINKVLASENQVTQIRQSQLAINEMLARYGFEFTKSNSVTADEARKKFNGKDWYQQIKGTLPSNVETLYNVYFSDIERTNFDALNAWQKANDADYYIAENGDLYRD